MGFLRRLLGRPDDARGEDDSSSGAAAPAAPATSPEEDERAHELELARFEQDRTTDLVRRQQMYSDKSWVPPAQGGAARAEGEDAESS